MSQEKTNKILFNWLNMMTNSDEIVAPQRTLFQRESNMFWIEFIKKIGGGFIRNIINFFEGINDVTFLQDEKHLTPIHFRLLIAYVACP